MPQLANHAAVAAYAEAVTDGVADELRHRLFRAIWAQGLHLSSADEVRRLITAVMWPQEDITDRLASLDIPSLLLRDTDLARIVRRLGGTIIRDGQPLTTAGWQRIRQWRQEWLALPSQVIPAVTGPDQVVRPGIDGLGYLADLAGNAGLRPRLPVHAGTAPGRDARPAATARAARPGRRGRGWQAAVLPGPGTPSRALPGLDRAQAQVPDPVPCGFAPLTATVPAARPAGACVAHLISTTSFDIK